MSDASQSSSASSSAPVTQPSACAVILCGGSGTRFGAATPKQFELLGGRPLFAWSVDRIAGIASGAGHAGQAAIIEVVLVLPEAGIPHVAEREIIDIEGRHPEVRFSRTIGGARRQDSVAAGLAALTSRCDVVLVHDSARPFLPVEAVENLIAEAHATGGALLACPATDTIKQADEQGRVAATLDRRTIWMAQTPQAFRAEYLNAVADLLRSEREFTDEAAALEALGVGVRLIPSPATNLKITTPEDLRRAAAMIDDDGQIAP